jgi:hypothetical protein
VALYNDTTIIGALGVSGDVSCADHNIAWRIRKALMFDNLHGGITEDDNDAIIYDIGLMDKRSSGYSHPAAGLDAEKVAKDIRAPAGTEAKPVRRRPKQEPAPSADRPDPDAAEASMRKLETN